MESLLERNGGETDVDDGDKDAPYPVQGNAISTPRPLRQTNDRSFRVCILFACLGSLIIVCFGVRSLSLQQQCQYGAVAQADKQTTTHISVLNRNETVYLNNSIGYQLLVESLSKRQAESYFDLQKGFDTQSNQMYCAVASVATVVNSLRTFPSVGEHLQRSTSFLPSYMTQEDVFNDCTSKNVVLRNDNFDGIFAFPYGLNLLQAFGLLKCHLSSNNWTVRSQFVGNGEITLDQMRSEISQALRRKDQRVLVNFDRLGLHQEGGGHVSPVAAYSESADAFLVLDISKYKYSPVWAPSSLLYDAMATEDPCGSWDFPFGQSRLPDALLYPRNRKQYSRASDMLQCQSTTRGYVVVSRRE